MLIKMCKTEWRKHYRSLKTADDRRQAKSERAKQTAEKMRIISEDQLQQRRNKHKQASSNMSTKYADGKQASSCKNIATKCLLASTFRHSSTLVARKLRLREKCAKKG